MPPVPAVPAPDGRRLSERLCRALGVRPGVILEAHGEGEASSALASFDPDASGRSFFLVDVIDEATGHRRLGYLRVLPLKPLPVSAGPLRPGRWTQEWKDLWAMSRSDSGSLQPMAAALSGRRRLPVLPPTFFCTKKQVFIEATCAGCPGPAQDEGPEPAKFCPACGSPDGSTAPAEAGANTALEILWKKARQAAIAASQGTKPAGSTSDPFCIGCDHRDRCYPATGPSKDPETAGSLLSPVSSIPWGGIVVEPFHLPLGAWFRLISGMPWAAVRRELKSVPPVILDEVDARFREERRFLYGPEAGHAFGLESFLLKLESIRQIVSTLQRLSAERGHPHLGLSHDTVWIRLEPSDCLRSALWSARAQLLDSAPGFREGAGETAADRFSPPKGRPAIYSPPGCGETMEWVEGLCIIKSGSTAGGAQPLVRVEFLPAVHFGRPPVKGDLVRLGLRAERTGELPRSLIGRVETALPEMCRILIHDSSLPPDEIRSLLTRGQGGATIRMSVVRDHSLADDLFAAGTFWITSLLTHPADFEKAARFRDELAPRLKGTRVGGGDTAIRESLKAAEASRLFAIQAGRDPIESSPVSRHGAAGIDPDLMARSLALGMRLCGAIPGGYPCQDHEPADQEERARAHDTLISMVVELGRQAREGLLGAATAPAGGDEILGALAAYARERSARTRGRGVPAPGTAGQKRTGEG